MKTLTIAVTSMSSLEIAELTGKRHDNVMADIRNMFEDLGILATDFSGTRTVRGRKDPILGVLTLQ